MNGRKIRAAKLNTGLRGLWEKLSGSAAKIKRENELEAWQASKRDQQQRDDLVKAQMQDRKALQKEIEKLRRKHTLDRRILARDVSQAMHIDDQAKRVQAQQRQQNRDRYRGPSL